MKLQDYYHECPTNRYERNFFPAVQGGKGMPTLYDTGVQMPWDFLAMELVGPSIDSLLRKSGKNVMDLRSVCCLGMQVVSYGVLCSLSPLALTRELVRSNVLSSCTRADFSIVTFSWVTVLSACHLMTRPYTCSTLAFRSSTSTRTRGSTSKTAEPSATLSATTGSPPFACTARAEVRSSRTPLLPELALTSLSHSAVSER